EHRGIPVPLQGGAHDQRHRRQRRVNEVVPEPDAALLLVLDPFVLVEQDARGSDPAVSRQEASPMIPPPNTGGSQCRRIIAKACGVLLVPLLKQHRHPLSSAGPEAGAVSTARRSLLRG